MKKHEEKELIAFIDDLKVKGNAIYQKQRAEREKHLNDPARKEHLEKVSESLLLAEQLYKLRKKAGLTQKQLAEKLSIKQPNLARIENGNQNITVNTLSQIAHACGSLLKISFLPVNPVQKTYNRKPRSSLVI